MFLQLKFFVTLAGQLGLSFLSVILEQLGAGRGGWMFFCEMWLTTFFPTTPLISTSICLPAGYKSIGCQCIDEPSIRVMLTTFLTLYVKNSRILLPQTFCCSMTFLSGTIANVTFVMVWVWCHSFATCQTLLCEYLAVWNLADAAISGLFSHHRLRSPFHNN